MFSSTTDSLTKGTRMGEKKITRAAGPSLLFRKKNAKMEILRSDSVTWTTQSLNKGKKKPLWSGKKQPVGAVATNH